MSHIDKGRSLSIIVDRFVPSHVRENHGDFVLFLQKYFEYLERDLGEYDIIAHLRDYADIDNTVDAFLPEFKKEYADKISDRLAADLKLVIKNIRDFYLAKGSEKSYEFLFHTIFNTFVDFYYPKIDILRVSDGKWIEPIYIVVTPNAPNDVTPYLDKKIIGLTSNSTAYVEKTIQVEYPALSGFLETSFSLLSVVGEFQDGEVIQIVDDVVTPTLTIQTPDGVVAAPGRWSGTDGFLSWNKYIQDNWYYQEFSYVIRSDISIDYYKKIIEENVHPAGFKFFGEVSFLEYQVSAFDDMVSTVFWIISWISQDLFVLQEQLQELEITLRPIQKTVSKDQYGYRTFETNRESKPFVNLFPLIEYWNNTQMKEFELRQGKYSTLVCLDGLKVDYDDYEMIDNELMFSSAPSNGVKVDVQYLNTPTYFPDKYIAPGAVNDFTLSRSPVSNSSILVFVNGIKLRKITEYYLTGTTLTIVATPSINDVIEVVYLEDNNYITGMEPELFVGDGSILEFSFTTDYDRGKHARPHNYIVTIDGVKLTPYLDYRTPHENLKFLFTGTIPQSGETVEVTFLKDVSLLEQWFTGDGASTLFFCDNIAERFSYVPRSLIQVV